MNSGPNSPLKSYEGLFGESFEVSSWYSSPRFIRLGNAIRYNTIQLKALYQYFPLL